MWLGGRERGTSPCDRGSPQRVLEERFPQLNFAPLGLREEWWGPSDASRGEGDAWWAVSYRPLEPYLLLPKACQQAPELP